MRFLGLSRVVFAGCLLGVAVAAGRGFAADLERGFVRVVQPRVTGEELGAQHDLWVLETTMKPMRIIWVDVTDPKTGKKSKEQIWYVVYKVVNRPVQTKVDTTDTAPVNVEDPAPQQIFAPAATLVADDNSGQRIYEDSIVPQARAAILKRERQELKDAVEIVGPIPPVTAADAKAEKPYYGVFLFRGVDPRADAYTLFLSGFSSAYQNGKDADGKALTLRRTIVQEYERPGDEFNAFEGELRLKGDARWVYRPDAPKAAKPAPARP